MINIQLKWGREILLLLVFIFSIYHSFGQTFQEELKEVIEKQSYTEGNYPYLNYTNNGDEYSFFWYNTENRFYLIFVKNETIFFVLNCRSLPVGEDQVGGIHIFPEKDYKSLTGTQFIRASENVMNDFTITEKPLKDDVVIPQSFDEKLDLTGSFLPIVVQLEVPVLYHYQNGILIELALEY